MSANTSIKEGGAPRSFGPVAALLVQGDEGKYFLWVPESERQLESLSVDKNGIYQAKKLGVYGWRSVSVNVPTSGSVTGKDPTTGQEVVVSKDPDTGEIVETVVPTEIRVITPPTNPYGIYTDGQAISTDGMIVKAYLASGGEYGTIPNGEIILNPAIAIYDASTDTASDYSSGGIYARKLTEDAYGLKLDNGFTVYYSSAITGHYPGGETVHLNGGLTQDDNNEIYYAVYNGHLYCAGLFNEIQVQLRNSAGVSVFNHMRPGSNFSSVYTLNDKASVFDAIQESTANPNGINPNTLKPVQSGSHQTITVSWPRPGDGAILETTFDILVGPRGGGGED